MQGQHSAMHTLSLKALGLTSWVHYSEEWAHRPLARQGSAAHSPHDYLLGCFGTVPAGFLRKCWLVLVAGHIWSLCYRSPPRTSPNIASLEALLRASDPVIHFHRTCQALLWNRNGSHLDPPVFAFCVSVKSTPQGYKVCYLHGPVDSQP